MNMEEILYLNFSIVSSLLLDETPTSICVFSQPSIFQNYTSYDRHLWYSFSHFFKIFVFQVISGVKGQKMAQNTA